MKLFGQEINMSSIPRETGRLVERLAAAQGIPVEEAIRRAVEASAREAGIATEPQKPCRRMTVDEMLAVGTEIAAMPLLDPRSPQEIMDDLNAV
jgi:antitoxin VapB